MNQDTQSQCAGTTQRGGVGVEVVGGIQNEGTHVHLWLIHVNVWQKRKKKKEITIFKMNYPQIKINYLILPKIISENLLTCSSV